MVRVKVFALEKFIELPLMAILLFMQEGVNKLYKVKPINYEDS